MSTPTTPPSSRRALVATCAALVLSAIPVALAAVLLHEQEHAARTEETRMLSEQAALRLADFVRARLLALEIVRRETANPAFVPDERFDSIAEATQAQYGGFQAINWMDADGVIRRIVPRAPNLPVLGRDLRLHEPTRDAVTEALRSRVPRATPPIDLVQGGRGFATYFPVVRDGELAGAINGVFCVDDLVRGCLGDALLQRYVVVIDDEGRAVYGDADAWSDEALEEQAAEAPAIPVLDRAWTMQLAPREAATSADPALRSFVAVGLAFSIALGLVAFLVTRRQQLRLEAEREQRRLEQQVAQGRRLEALGRLAGGIAHDFNNLLAVILGATELALRRSSGDLRSEVKESLEDVLTAAERAAGLTRQLLGFAHEQPRDERRLELGDVLRTTERMLRRLVREDVELHVHCPDDAVWVVSDAAQLTQIIVNLVVNASDAITGAGRIDVTLEARDGRGAREPQGRWAVLEVRDDGPGIAPADVERVYEPFFTTKGQRGGTGLGLATVYGLLTQHGGHVTVESELGAGATFRAFFPIAPEGSARDVADEATPDVAEPGEGVTVLLVEDEELLRRATVRALTSAGHRVIDACDGVDAIEKLDAGLRPDVVVSDLVMPRMGGLELLRVLRGRGERAPAVLVSGHADVEISEDELRALDARFVPKPYTVAVLTSAVRDALARQEELI